MAGDGMAGSGSVIPFAEENLPGLLETYRMSSYFNSAQNLVTSFQQTGSLARAPGTSDRGRRRRTLANAAGPSSARRRSFAQANRSDRSGKNV